MLNLFKFHTNPEQLFGFDQVVSNFPIVAFDYAKDVVKGKFPEGEAAIAKNSELAYWYARNVIEKEFPEGEAAIAEDPELAYWYAEDVIKGRWPKGEAAITKSQTYRKLYQKFLNKLGNK